MDATSTHWEYYLAVTDVEKDNIQAREVLKPSVFSHHPAPTFFKLFVSFDIAVDEAMKQRTLQSLMAVSKTTKWFILKLRLTHEAVARLFMRRKAPCIEHGPPEGKGFRFFGELDISELTKEWEEKELPKLDIDGWKVPHHL